MGDLENLPIHGRPKYYYYFVHPDWAEFYGLKEGDVFNGATVKICKPIEEGDMVQPTPSTFTKEEREQIRRQQHAEGHCCTICTAALKESQGKLVKALKVLQFYNTAPVEELAADTLNGAGMYGGKKAQKFFEDLGGTHGKVQKETDNH